MLAEIAPALETALPQDEDVQLAGQAPVRPAPKKVATAQSAKPAQAARKQTESPEPVVYMTVISPVVEAHKADEAASPSPAKQVDYASSKPAPVLAVATQKPEASEQAQFNASKYAAPILGLLALLALAFWSGKRVGAAGAKRANQSGSENKVA